MRYDAFMSYSHAADGRLAPALQSGLHRLAKPWYRLRALRVFRDKTSLAANPGLWAAIESALATSRFFVLMASPQAAASPWVGREIAWWLEHRSPELLLIALTDGEMVWRPATSDFDPERTTALPPMLLGQFRDEPLHVDLRWARSTEKLSLRHGQFRSAVLDMAATLHGKPKDVLDGDDVRQYRQARLLAALAVLGLVGLSVASALATFRAVQQRELAVSRELSAMAAATLARDPELSVLLAIEAAGTAGTTQAQSVLRQALLETHYEASLRGHRGSIHAMALSPDGTRLLTGSADKSARIWDIRAGSALAELSGHTGAVTQAAFSPDGYRVATASAFDRTVRVWNADGTPLRTIAGHTARWSPDGRRVLSALADGSAVLWEVESGRVAVALRGHTDWVHDAALSPDGRYAVTASRDRTARIWDAGTGRSLAVLRDDESEVTLAVISPTGDRVVTVGGTGAGRVWQLPDGRPVARLEGHTDAVTRAVWSSDGRYIATASQDNTARVWDAGNGRAVQTLSGHADDVRDVAWNSDDTRLVTASVDRTARIWGAGGRGIAILRGHEGAVTEALFGRDGQTVYTAGLDVDVRKWRATRAWHRVELRGHSGSVDYAAFTADGRHVLTVDGGRTLRLWDPATGFALLTFRTAADTSVVAPSPAGDLVVTALRSNHLATVWSVANGERRTDLLGHSGPVSCAGWSGTATRVITASWDGSARVWDVASGRNLAEFPGHGSQHKRVCPSLSPDGALALVGGSDDVVRVWNVAQRHLVLELRGHTRGLNSVAWSADGALIVTSGNDSLVRVWEALSGRVVKEVPMRYQQGRGALSTDKHWLITTGGDNLRVWALETGLEISVVGGHASLINDANWSADGAAIVTGGSDGVAIVHPWELFAAFESVLGAACNRVTGNMTHAEWERYMGSTRYRATCPSRPVPEALSGR